MYQKLDLNEGLEDPVAQAIHARQHFGDLHAAIKETEARRFGIPLAKLPKALYGQFKE